MWLFCNDLQIHVAGMHHIGFVAVVSGKSCEITLYNLGGIRMTTSGIFNQKIT